jgi:hypothetical protein
LRPAPERERALSNRRGALYLPGMSAPPRPTGAVAWLLERMFLPQPGWEHPPLLSLLEGLTVEQVLWRPGPDRRCIWQYVRHMLAWQTFVLDRLRGEAPPAFSDPWPDLPDVDDEAELSRCWSVDLERLQARRAGLIAAVEALDPEEPHPHPDLAHLPHWIAPLGVQIHDSYHAGQIALLRGLQGLPPTE